jgi:tRNA (Thr-GGU) A37 N-methylase
MESDIAYFRRRASEERTAALAAVDKRAREAHVQLAERYEDIVRGIAHYDEFVALRWVAGAER